ncbi:MAG TPA: cyclodeaminase/cyclohydrolase family protein [Candidatus Acidoferrales bacterium]|nr:cyclodeaminase/cyclohydrolase family protein [Candidatus Acidoferrales bacterium]
MVPARVSEFTLEEFRKSAASEESVPAGVAIAAVSASLALGLLAKVLTIAGRRRDFGGDPSQTEALAKAAKDQSERMLAYAEEDIAAFSAYIASVRGSNKSAGERKELQRALDAATRKAIEIPMGAARAAASGIGLCADAAGLVHSLVAADLGTAATILSAAQRVFLMCADSNLKLLASDPTEYEALMVGRKELELSAHRQAQSVLRQVTTAIETANTDGGRNH